MASAAAVAADQARSPYAEPDSVDGAVSSAILPSDAKVPNDLSELNQDVDDDDDDDDEDVPRSRPRGPKVNGAQDEEEDDEQLGDDDDLFGDGDEDEDGVLDDEAPAQQRTLDDEDLDSGDDEGREDRVHDEDGDREATPEKELAIMEAAMGRLPGPEPSDGEMYLAKVPRFLSIDPKKWHYSTYQPPTTDHHSDTPSPLFSAYNTALSTVHWRKSPSNPHEIQSNARVLRWSDGSLTLQFASNPTQQYVIEGNPLAPRQSRPVKPTPTSRKPGQKEHGYDTYTYLTAPDPHNQLLRVTHKITAGLSILPSADATDDALEKLQTSLAAIAQGKNSSSGGIELVPVNEDPELAKKQAEQAEREKQRMRKKQEAAENRDRERTGRSGPRRAYGGGLSASMLEDDDMGARPRGNRAKQGRRTQRANSEYSDDEDFGRKRGNFANDEYDEEDEFIAKSDEEEDAVDDSDSDDGIVDERSKRRDSAPKRRSPDVADDDDEDAEDEEEVVQSSRIKRRRVVDEDDED